MSLLFGLFGGLMKVLMTVLTYFLKNWIAISIGVVGTLAAEHGFRWTWNVLVECWNRNTSSIKDNLKNPPGFFTKLKRFLVNVFRRS